MRVKDYIYKYSLIVEHPDTNEKFAYGACALPILNDQRAVIDFADGATITTDILVEKEYSDKNIVLKSEKAVYYLYLQK